jgi:hypothetical protein
VSDAPIPPAALSTAARWGCSLAFVRLHWGPHTCLDSRRYASGCLITNPTSEAEALRLMTGGPVSESKQAA